MVRQIFYVHSAYIIMIVAALALLCLGWPRSFVRSRPFTSVGVDGFRVETDLARMREATEGAARENIALFIMLLDKERL